MLYSWARSRGCLFSGMITGQQMRGEALLCKFLDPEPSLTVTRVEKQYRQKESVEKSKKALLKVIHSFKLIQRV
jgi:hypothetical protein